MISIIDRSPELELLGKFYQAERAQLLAVYGRRRIGKTFLINEFFRDKGLYFELTGIKDVSVKTQLVNFAGEYADVFNFGKPIPPPTTWFKAFELLRKEVQKRNGEGKIILFFDELPWLASPRSHFLAALDHTWNRYFSRIKNLIVVICGSAASWMIKKVLQNKGGLHGRLTGKLHMMPFTLKETRTFLEAQRIQFPPRQLIELYMGVGGVAQYLTGLTPGQSVSQLIQSRYFEKAAPLRAEFHPLFASLFDDYTHHLAVIEALAGSHYGLSVDELLAKTGLPSGGSFTLVLTELLEAGFILFLPQFGNKKKAGKYVLADEFTLFYLKWVREWETGIADLSGHWQRQSNTPAFRSWAGYAFETICIKNIAGIKQQLGIAGVTARVSQWRDEHTQIDLVIDRDDQCINLCEIKFHGAQYAMTEKDAGELQRKKARFLEKTGTRKAVFLTLITVHGAVRNAHYINSVDNHVDAAGFVEG